MSNLTVNNLTVLGQIQYADQTVQTTSNADILKNVTGITRDALNQTTRINSDNVILEQNVTLTQTLDVPIVKTNALQFLTDLDEQGNPVVQTKGFSEFIRNQVLETKDKIDDLIPAIIEPPLKKAKLSTAEFITPNYATSINDVSIVQESLSVGDVSRTQIEPNSIQLRASNANTAAISIDNDDQKLHIGCSTAQIDFEGNAISNIYTINGLLVGESNKILCTSDNTSGNYYIPFAKTNVTGQKQLFIDDVTGPLMYNPSLGTLTASSFQGNATSASTATTATTANNVFVTSTPTTNLTYFVNFTILSSGSSPIRADTAFTYNPSTDTLTVPNLNGTALNATNAAILPTTDNVNYHVNFSQQSGNNRIRSNPSLTYNPQLNKLDVNSGEVSCSTLSTPLIKPSLGILTLETNSLTILGDETQLLQATSGGNSGQFLKITISGVDYVIKLEHPYNQP